MLLSVLQTSADRPGVTPRRQNNRSHRPKRAYVDIIFKLQAIFVYRSSCARRLATAAMAEFYDLMELERASESSTTDSGAAPASFRADGTVRRQRNVTPKHLRLSSKKHACYARNAIDLICLRSFCAVFCFLLGADGGVLIIIRASVLDFIPEACCRVSAINWRARVIEGWKYTRYSNVLTRKASLVCQQVVTPTAHAQNAPYRCERA